MAPPKRTWFCMIDSLSKFSSCVIAWFPGLWWNQRLSDFNVCCIANCWSEVECPDEQLPNFPKHASALEYALLEKAVLMFFMIHAYFSNNQMDGFASCRGSHWSFICHSTSRDFPCCLYWCYWVVEFLLSNGNRRLW
jgi:hypothetical protein